MKKKRRYKCIGGSLPDNHPSLCHQYCIHRFPHLWRPKSGKDRHWCYNAYDGQDSIGRWQETKKVYKCDCYTLNTIEKLKNLVLLKIIEVVE